MKIEFKEKQKFTQWWIWLLLIGLGAIAVYGIRLGSKYGTVYNMSGDKGLAIELNNGKKFVIGTQKELELKKVVEKCQLLTNNTPH